MNYPESEQRPWPTCPTCGGEHAETSHAKIAEMMELGHRMLEGQGYIIVQSPSKIPIGKSATGPVQYDNKLQGEVTLFVQAAATIDDYERQRRRFCPEKIIKGADPRMYYYLCVAE
jgi:hypothetical protein